MLKTENKLKIFVLFMFFSVLFSQLIFYGTNAIIADFQKNNPTITPLSLTGAGTYLQPYLITNDNDLNNLCAYTNSGGDTYNTYFKLTAENLDENGALVVSLKTPIGTSTYPFQGIFDGNNLTLTGATLATNAQNQTGIFGAVKNATIKNLTVAYKTQNTTSSTLGGIVATAYSSNIINCTNKTEIHNTATDSMVAGIVGYAYNTQIYDCLNEKNINSLTGGEISYTGGIVAYSYNTTIFGCAIKSSDVTINSSGAKVNICGAISSSVSGGSTSQCFNMSAVSASVSGDSSSYAGGIVGKATNHTITDCFNRGYISSLAKESISNKITPTSYAYYYQKDTYAYAGGICGSGSSTTISNCYNTSPVNGGTQIYDIQFLTL